MLVGLHYEPQARHCTAAPAGSVAPAASRTLGATEKTFGKKKRLKVSAPSSSPPSRTLLMSTRTPASFSLFSSRRQLRRGRSSHQRAPWCIFRKELRAAEQQASAFASKGVHDGLIRIVRYRPRLLRMPGGLPEPRPGFSPLALRASSFARLINQARLAGALGLRVPNSRTLLEERARLSCPYKECTARIHRASKPLALRRGSKHGLKIRHYRTLHD